MTADAILAAIFQAQVHAELRDLANIGDNSDKQISRLADKS